MKTIYFPPAEDPGDARNAEKGADRSIDPYLYETNLSEGSEFLDDAIRMHDQPFEEKNDNEWDEFLEGSFE